MILRSLPIALLVLALCSAPRPADAAPTSPDPDAQFTAACELLDAGDHAAARDALTRIIEAGHFAPEVFFQLGNAHFRLGQAGPAALSYHRALYLDPTHRESSQNLAVVEKRSGSISNDDTEQPTFLRHLSDPLLSRALSAGIWIVAIGLAIMLLSRRQQRRLRGSALVAIIAGATLTGASACAAYGKDASRPSPATTIIVTAATLARTAPTESAAQVLALPPGSQISLIARRGTWIYADLPDSLRGWLPASSTERLWPFAPGGVDD